MSNKKADSTQPASKRARLEQREIKCVDDLYLKEKFADVWFSFDSVDGTTTRIPAHKLLLAVVSDVFEAMFFGGLKETGDIVITDASPGEFEEFLQFFYGKNVKLTTERVAGVMNLGHKYNVENCVDACVEHLKQNLTDENVCAALSLAILYDQKDLTMVCGKRIQLNTDAALQSAAFLECSKEALAHILQMNPLSCSEVNVFEACMAWVRAKSEHGTVTNAMVKKHLGDLYREIRFASMTIQEFCTLKTKYSAVLSSDFEAITRVIARMDTNSQLFNTSLRQIKWNENKRVRCNRDYHFTTVGWLALNIEEKISFSVGEPLALGNFYCNGIYYGENDRQKLSSFGLTVVVEITEARTLDDSDVKILSNFTTKLHSEFTTVSLPQPILIRPNHFYSISLKGFPRDHYFKSNVQMSSLTLESGIKIEFYNDKIVEGKIGGLIYKLEFNEI